VLIVSPSYIVEIPSEKKKRSRCPKSNVKAMIIIPRQKGDLDLLKRGCPLAEVGC
jgi:hypothetical protein